MNAVAEARGRRRMPWRAIGWGFAAAVLAFHAVAMRFTDEVKWDETDFIFVGLLFGLVGLGIELAVRASSSWAFRGGAALALLSCFALVLVNAAVGMVGDEDNRYNLLFLGLVPFALIGAAAARLRAAGMAVVMLLAGLAQIAIGAFAIAQDPRGGVLSMIMAGSWLLAALLFRIAARAGRTD